MPIIARYLAWYPAIWTFLYSFTFGLFLSLDYLRIITAYWKLKMSQFFILKPSLKSYLYFTWYDSPLLFSMFLILGAFIERKCDWKSIVYDSILFYKSSTFLYEQMYIFLYRPIYGAFVKIKSTKARHFMQTFLQSRQKSKSWKVSRMYYVSRIIFHFYSLRECMSVSYISIELIFRNRINCL